MGEQLLEERIVELEIRHTEQQDLLEQLNEALVEQQKAMDFLRAELDRLRRRVESLPEPGQVDAGIQEKPPHY
jgi:SlyX protein